MKETVSRIGPGGAAIERACDWSMLQSADADLRMKCRNAPEFIRRNIDAKREARGLRPLWGSRASGSARSQPAVVAAAVERWKAYLTLARGAVAAKQPR